MDGSSKSSQIWYAIGHVDIPAKTLTPQCTAACWRRIRHASLTGMLAEQSVASLPDRAANPFVVQPPHHRATAKRCIFIYLPGGPSQIDLFDPKPEVTRQNGKPLPFEKPELFRTDTSDLFASKFKFRQHGQSGIEVSELLPHIADCIDDICVVRSMVTDNINHGGAALQMHTGEQAFSRPSVGSWVTYGLGSENQNLPGFVVISPNAVFQNGPCTVPVFCRPPIRGPGSVTWRIRSPI